MAELADAPDLGSGGTPRAGSSPVTRILKTLIFQCFFYFRVACRVACYVVISVQVYLEFFYLILQ